jgi:hypothetical protein
MRRRCESPVSADYPHYGGRGIRVCDRWKSFENFLADMGERPEAMSLDRIDVEGDYTPANCRWATATQQNRNRRPRRVVHYGGRSWTTESLAKHLGLAQECLVSRLKRKWPIERLSEPAHR